MSMVKVKASDALDYVKNTQRVDSSTILSAFEEAKKVAYNGVGKCREIDESFRWGVRRTDSGEITPHFVPEIKEPITWKKFESIVKQDSTFDSRVMEQYVDPSLFAPFTQYVRDSLRQDRMVLRADEGSIFFARQLEYLKQRSYDVLYPSITYNRVMSVDSSPGGGPTSVTWNSYDPRGTAKIITNPSDDLPIAEVTGQQFNQPIFTVGMSFMYTYQELRSALYANKSIDTLRSDSSRMSVEQFIDKCSFLGNAQYQIPGLLSISGALAQTVSAGTAPATTTWASKIANGEQDLVLQDMLTLVSTIQSQTKMTQAPDTMVLPIAQYALISSTPRSSNSDTTILNYFMQQNPSIKKVAWSQWMTGASSTGQDVFMVFDSSPDRLQVSVPMPYLQHAPQPQNLSYLIPTETRFSGVMCYYPNSVGYGLGI